MWVVKGILNDDWITRNNYEAVLGAFKPLISEDIALDVHTYIEGGSSNKEAYDYVVKELQETIDSFMQTRLLIKNEVPAVLAGLRLQDVYTYYTEGYVPSGTPIQEIKKHCEEILHYGSSIRLNTKVATTVNEYLAYVDAITECVADESAIDFIMANKLRIYSPNAKPRSNPMALLSYAYKDLTWVEKSIRYLDIISADNNLKTKGVLYNFAST